MKINILIGKYVAPVLALSMAVLSADATPTVTGDVVYSGQLASGTNLKAGKDQNSDVQVFLESSETLSSALYVDELPTAFNTPGDIAAGTSITDYLLHYDYPGTTGGNNASGTITFSGDIIGLIINGQTLLNTDSILGVGGVTYPTSSDRGLESGDDWSVSGDQLTFNISDWTSSSGVDEVRVLVALPDGGATIGLLGLGFFTLAFFGFRQNRLQLAK